MALLNMKSSTLRLPSSIDALLPADIGLVPAKTIAFSFRYGMESLIRNLVSEISAAGSASLLTNVKCDKIEVNSSGGFTLYAKKILDNSHLELNVDSLFMCLPAYKAAGLLSGHLFPDELLDKIRLTSLPWANVAVVVLELDGHVPPPHLGFGHLVPRCEDLITLGVIYDSVCLPHMDATKTISTRYTVMMSPPATWMDQFFSASEKKTLPIGLADEMEVFALSVLTRHLGIQNPQVLGRQVSILPNCIPQYPVGHTENIDLFRCGIRSCLPAHLADRLKFVGNSYDGVGIADVVLSSVMAVDSIFG
ncbi:unnamed protein product [Protopolystoma xenopodis]|uniref:Amine oxidase domain-containing protein n=1 Tax=Protopolystoma xenopodis TaxID=117903 RepID=A0A448WSY5_9PLAT|nr:unnamed protein product [Protopolystoma xenopodis]